MGNLFKKEQIADEGYHLGPLLLRLAAASIDAVFFSAVLGLVALFCFPNGSFGTIGDALGIPDQLATLNVYQQASGLEVRDGNGNLSDVRSSDYAVYEDAIKTYYFVYNAESSAVNPHPHVYTVADYNVSVLDLPSDVKNLNTSSFYSFATTDGESDPTKLGVLRKVNLNEDGTVREDAKAPLLSFYQKKYALTQDALMAEDYYKSLSVVYSANMQTIEAITVFIPFLLVYFAIPMFSPYARTLGKKFMKLALIDNSGMPLEKWRLILRALPFIVTLGAAIFIDNVAYSLSLIILVFLLTVGLGALTFKKRTIHDFCARSVVVREDDAFPTVEKNQETGSATVSKEGPHA